MTHIHIPALMGIKFIMVSDKLNIGWLYVHMPMGTCGPKKELYINWIRTPTRGFIPQLIWGGILYGVRKVYPL